MAETLQNFEDNNDRIAKKFVNKTILVSGATGFVGKVFLEKLLRTCPDVAKIYVLVRIKKEKDPNERMREIFGGPLYDVLRKQGGEQIFKKVEAISANIAAADLELDDKDRIKLSEEVEVIYHSAATVRFDEPLQKAVFINVRGTKLMLELAKECKKLTIFVHVSTAYCHLNERILYEKAYPPPADPHMIIKTCEWVDEKALETLSPKIIGNIPNTYSFTKALGEALVVAEMENLPVIILRPSVIVPIWKEPLPGWVDNLNGPMGLLIGAGKGVIRTMYCNGDRYSDYMPVDIIANLLMICPFFYYEKKKRIFNLTSSFKYKISFEEVINIGRDLVCNEIPFNGVLWYPGGSMKRNRWHHNIEFFLFQLIPAIFLDALLIILGYKPVLMRVQKRVVKGYDVLEYYANNQWDFNNDESLALLETLNPKERATYKVDGDGLVYYDYFRQCIKAARLYLLKEPEHTLPAAKRHMQIMWVADRLCKALFILGFLYMLYKHFVVPVLNSF